MGIFEAWRRQGVDGPFKVRYNARLILNGAYGSSGAFNENPQISGFDADVFYLGLELRRDVLDRTGRQI